MAQPVFKMSTIESPNTIYIENEWCAFIQIRVTAIEYKEKAATAIFL